MKTVIKPWGREEWWAETDKYVAKLLHINKGHRTSLQYHRKKLETILVQKGNLMLTLNSYQTQLSPGMKADIKPMEIHRLEAIEDDVELIEVSTPETDDVIRLEDEYGRSK